MKLLIAGDYCPHDRVAKRVENGDYAFFEEMKPYIKEADYSILNLECPIVKGDERPIVKSGPNLLTTNKVIDSLKFLGIDGVTLANNHILDYGCSALQNTCNELNQAKIDYVGVGDNILEAQQILYKEVGEIKLAIINCCEHECSIAGEKTSGANPLNPIAQFYAIKEARRTADYVIVIIHGGPEHYQLPTPRMQDTYRFFVDTGADVVVNHHQHCYSGYEIYNEKPIFYGLGNLCFDRKKRNSDWNFGNFLMLRLEQGKIDFQLIPYEQSNADPTITILQNDAKYEATIANLNSKIANQKLLLEEYYKFLEKDRDKYRCFVEPYKSKLTRLLFRKQLLPSFIKPKYIVLANVIRCESHVDRLLKALEL